VIGSAFDDVLIGDTHANHLSGGDGNDMLTGGSGGDVLDGGAGENTVIYHGSMNFFGADVDLTTGQGSNLFEATDVLINIQDVIGSNFGDTIIGNGGVNNLSGGDGNDIITGGGGADFLDGGNGTDTISYAASSAGVSVNLTTNVVSGGDG
jgi:Ca2+-binding RTX toxin-like protein